MRTTESTADRFVFHVYLCVGGLQYVTLQELHWLSKLPQCYYCYLFFYVYPRAALSSPLLWCTVGPTEGWDSGANKGKGKLEEVYATVPLEDGGLSCQAEIDCLDPGNEYLLRVYATNAQGSSPPSAVGTSLYRACTAAWCTPKLDMQQR